MAVFLVGGYALKEYRKRGPDPAPKLTAATTEEAEAFGRELVAAHPRCATAAAEVNALVDTESVVYRSLDRIDLKPAEKRAFISTATQSAGNFLCNHLRDAKLTLLRVREVDAERRPIFRALHDDGAFGYIEMIVAKREGGPVRAIDVYPFTTGEWLSRSLADLTNSLAAGDKGLSERVAAIEEVTKKIDKASKDESWKDALAALDRLPDKLRSTKAMQGARVQAASHLGDEQYQRAIEAYEKAFPDDPSLDLVSIDAHYLRKEFDKIPPILERLSARVGGDALLDARRAAVHLELKETDKALAAAKRATAAEPELRTGWEQLAVAPARKGDLEATLAAQRELKRRFDVAYPDTDPEFAAFYASPQGKTFAAELEQGQTAP